MDPDEIRGRTGSSGSILVANILDCCRFIEQPEKYGKPPTPQYMTGGGEEPFEYRDIETMSSKKELEADIDSKQQKIEKYKRRIERLEGLGKKYEHSKRYSPHRRYGEMRRIVKEIINY